MPRRTRLQTYQRVTWTTWLKLSTVRGRLEHSAAYSSSNATTRQSLGMLLSVHGSPHIHKMLFFLALLPLASAWGFLGHRTVAYLAQLHFTPAAEAWVEDLLNGQDISEAAIWPDKIAHLPQFSYTKNWHYIDAQDSPPQTCMLNFTRDCLGSCVVSAIANHTTRVQDLTLNHTDRGQSMRFVLHFFGDLHQPLHTEHISRGGNGIPVMFDGNKTNLHSVWDSYIPKKHINISDEIFGARAWAASLFQNEPLLECTIDAVTCALEWAAEANQYVCSYVLKDGVMNSTLNLGDDYYEGAIEIVDTQIRRAGRRLAAWINSMAPPLLQVQ